VAKGTTVLVSLDEGKVTNRWAIWRGSPKLSWAIEGTDTIGLLDKGLKLVIG
jgi:hypothetical protein